MPFINAAELRRLRRDVAAFEKGRDSAARKLVEVAKANQGLEQEIADLRRFLNHDLPAEVANPARRIWELKAKVRGLTAARARWRARAMVAERALANQMALPLSANGILEAFQVHAPDSEDTVAVAKVHMLGSQGWLYEKQTRAAAAAEQAATEQAASA